MTAFTPLSALAGGALIGVSAVLLMLLNGRVAGISGITAGLLTTSHVPDRGWRLAFVAGLVAAPLGLTLLGSSQVINFVAPVPIMILAGLLVGFGTVLGNGCTSGHGVCGLARLSPRSLAATAVFMAVGFAATFLFHHLYAGG
jgi:uncharacterized protein